MRPLYLYMLGTGSWFLAFGIQGVMFAWLVAIVLHESPEMVGVAQMSLLLPGTVLILIGGSYADRFGGKRIAIGAQFCAMLAPLVLLLVVAGGGLTFAVMVGYALFMGCAQAFVTPARDGLLNQVAEGRVQRTVMLVSTVQFGMQMVGFLIASWADSVGAVPILALQTGVLLLGVVAIGRLPARAVSARPDPMPLARSVLQGARTVLAIPATRVVMVQNIAMAMFFMGSFIVTMPLLVREVFHGSARDLALVSGANSLGLVLTILLLLRLGDVHRQGRALILAHGAGAAVLAAAAFAPRFGVFVFAVFWWGVCGGMAITMARTIMQEQAPEGQLGRVMSFYAFTFMGAGPIGALLSGYLVERLGPQLALFTSASTMLVVMVLVRVASRLWYMDSRAPVAA